MSEFTSSIPWGEEFMSMVQDTGLIYDADTLGVPAAALETEIPGFHTVETEIPVFHTFEAEEGELGESESFKDHVKGFAKAWGEMVFELGKGCKDIVAQNYLTEDSYAVRKLRGPVAKVLGRLRYLNEYLPEDRDPFHAWSVIILVFFLALAVLNVNNGHDSSVPRGKKVYIHPPSATRILLPDGRHMAYREQGVPRDRARYSLISPHGFLSSRLAGIPGVKESLLEEFGVRLITYDLPGFGESDPHPKRNLNTSALDMVDLANALGVNDKFWVLGFSSGAMHAWAALKYIPSRIAGAAMFAPMVNPYESSMTKEEMSGTWEVWVQRRKLMYNLARRFPTLLRYFYSQTFLSGKHGQIDTWLSLSLGNKDKALTENAEFEEFWHRDVEESIRQFNVQPFIEEAVLLVSSWGFKLADLQVQRKCPGKGIFSWLKFMYSQAECELTGFLGPVHIWQGMDDLVVPSSMTDYVARVLPGANVHRLPDEGHFSYFFFCDERHRQIFSTLFRSPEGPLVSTNQYRSGVDESFSVLS